MPELKEVASLEGALSRVSWRRDGVRPTGRMLALAATIFVVVFGIGSAQAQFTVIHTFTGSPADGKNPVGGLINDNGVYYGTTCGGGLHGLGTVFRIDAGGESIVYSFSGNPDGECPRGNLVLTPTAIYGTTWGGGAFGCGTVFGVTTGGAEGVVYSFGAPGDGIGPNGLVGDPTYPDLFYGTTFYGGTNNQGTVFEASSLGAERVLHNFSGKLDGSSPKGGISVHGGWLYGTAEYGGTFGSGTLYRIFASSGSFQMLNVFRGGATGTNPTANLYVDPSGNVYGTTFAGGFANAGILFKFSAGSVFSVLHAFAGGPNDGASPQGGFAVVGNLLYGTTEGGGVVDDGTLYEMNLVGVETVLDSFFPNPRGDQPLGDLILDPTRRFVLGTTSGYAAGDGTVFKYQLP